MTEREAVSEQTRLIFYHIFGKITYFVLRPCFAVAFALLFIIFHPYIYASIRLGLFNKQRALLNLCKAAHFLLLLSSLSRVERVFRNDVSSIFHKTKLPIREDLPLLVVANHQSAYDISSIILTLPKRRLFFIAKKELRWLPSFSTLLKYYNGIFIDRSNPKSAVEQITTRVESIKKEIPASQLGFVVFPEGTRARDGILKQFKTTGTKVILEHFDKIQVIPVIFTRNYLFGKQFCVRSEMVILEPRVFESDSVREIELFIHEIFHSMKAEYSARQKNKPVVK